MIPVYIDKNQIDTSFLDMLNNKLILIKYVNFKSNLKNESFDFEWFDNNIILEYITKNLK